VSHFVQTSFTHLMEQKTFEEACFICRSISFVSEVVNIIDTIMLHLSTDEEAHTCLRDFAAQIHGVWQSDPVFSPGNIIAGHSINTLSFEIFWGLVHGLCSSLGVSLVDKFYQFVSQTWISSFACIVMSSCLRLDLCFYFQLYDSNCYSSKWKLVACSWTSGDRLFTSVLFCLMEAIFSCRY